MSKNNQHTEFLCIDVESTCYAEGQADGKMSEIIEIGYAVFDATNNLIHSNGSIFVKPQYSNVTQYCTNLTGITPEMVNNGVGLEEACDILKKDLNSLSRPWCSFGEYDRTMFTEDCKRANISYPFTKQHLNAKQMAAAILGKTQGLGATINALGLQFVGTQHSGKADAFNVARILEYYRTKFGEKILA